MKSALPFVFATLFYLSAFCQETLQSVADRSNNINTFINRLPASNGTEGNLLHEPLIKYGTTVAGNTALAGIYGTNRFSNNYGTGLAFYTVRGKFINEVAMVMSPEGLSGLGISVPQNRLHIKGDALENSQLILERTGTSGKYRLGVAAGINCFAISDIAQGDITRFLIDASGNVGIGTTTATEKLSVKGKIRAQEIKVEAAGIAWPDYVFAKEYRLIPLVETEAFIMKHQHLPGIPSAKEVGDHGLNLGEMNALLLKKIEELTLHLIEKDKEIAALQKGNKRIDELEMKLNQLIK